MYLVRKMKDGNHAFCARISTLQTPDEYDEAPGAGCPDYYWDIDFSVGLWVIVDSPLSSVEIDDLKLVVNDKSLTTVLSECGTSMMLVTTK